MCARHGRYVAPGLLLLLLSTHHAVARFSYDGPHGPNTWPGICRTGGFQSPVDIQEGDAEVFSFEPVQFVDRMERQMTITNNGHTVAMSLSTVNEACRPAVAAGGLPGVYVFDSMHFHWPSEHTLNGEGHPLELHMVYFLDKYSSLQEALRDPKGVAVFAVFFQLSLESSRAMQVVHDGVSRVAPQAYSSAFLVSPIRLQELLPSSDSKFFRYRGSLTTPQCNESVVWTIFTETLPVTQQQLDSFPKVLSAERKPLRFNNRPVQKLNSRIVFISGAATMERASITAISASLLLMIVSHAI